MFLSFFFSDSLGKMAASAEALGSALRGSADTWSAHAAQISRHAASVLVLPARHARVVRACSAAQGLSGSCFCCLSELVPACEAASVFRSDLPPSAWKTKLFISPLGSFSPLNSRANAFRSFTQALSSSAAPTRTGSAQTHMQKNTQSTLCSSSSHQRAAADTEALFPSSSSSPSLFSLLRFAPLPFHLPPAHQLSSSAKHQSTPTRSALYRERGGGRERE